MCHLKPCAKFTLVEHCFPHKNNLWYIPLTDKSCFDSMLTTKIQLETIQ